jgi:hypothetical protein
MARSVQTKNRGECVVYGPYLFDSDVTDSLAQALHVDRSKLLDENPCDRPANLDLRSERGWPSAVRCWRNDDDRPRQQFVCLHYDREPFTSLLMSDAFRHAKFVHITAAHASTPSATRPTASRRDPARPPRGRLPLLRAHGDGSIGPPKRATRNGSLRKVSDPKLPAFGGPARHHRRDELRSLWPFEKYDTLSYIRQPRAGRGGKWPSL